VRKIYHKADLIAANCEELSKDISFMVRKKVETIYNPCFFKIMQARAKKKISKKINILNISRFEYQKDHLTLLKAIQNSKIKNKIKLNLVGYGSQESVIKNYANKNNIDCKIYKKKTKLSYFYRSNDIFILTSIYEGLPTVMIEAASHCMPIISSRFKSGSVEILGNGKFGYMFPVGNYKLLAKLLNNFNNKPELFHLKEKKCRKNLSKFSYTNNLKKFNISLKNLSNQII
jgi:glycosyltransferase involved in cell wall biosynthesis